MIQRALSIIALCLVLVSAAGCGLSLPPGAAVQEAQVSPAGRFPEPPPGLLDDLARALGTADREAPIGGAWHLPAHLPPGLAPDFVEAGYDTFVALRNGEDEDRAVAKVACHVMGEVANADNDPHAESWRSRIYEGFYPEFQPNGPYNWLISSQVENAATALNYATNATGGVRQYYFHYCFSWTDLATG